MYVCMYVRMYACVYVCLYVCTHVCMYVCMYARVHDAFLLYILCMYTYGHALRGPPLPPPPWSMVQDAPSCGGGGVWVPLPPVGWLWGFWGFS